MDTKSPYATVALDIINSPLGAERIIPELINYQLPLIFREDLIPSIMNNFRMISLINTFLQIYDLGLQEDFSNFLLENDAKLMIKFLSFLHIPTVQELLIKVLYIDSKDKTSREKVVKTLLFYLLDENHCFQASSFLERLIQLENYDYILKSEEIISELFDKMLKSNSIFQFESCFAYFSYLLTQNSYPKCIVKNLNLLSNLLKDHVRNNI